LRGGILFRVTREGTIVALRRLPRSDSASIRQARHRGPRSSSGSARGNPKEIVMFRKTITTSAAALALLALAACGSSTGDRALSGGAIGAGAGAVGGAIVGAPLTGAVIGGAAGAATGAVTDEDDIDLGDPIWD
jgi:hypothetical protein